MHRRKTRQIKVRAVPIGAGAPVSVQSMTNTDTRDVKATLAQIRGLEDAGCDIVRLAVVDMKAAESIGDIRRETGMPLVADIHFDYRLALQAVRSGADKIRINPGNIGSPDRVRQVAEACGEQGVPIRVGVNSGSLETDILEKYGDTPEAMVESALRHIELLERFDFRDICVSLKAPDVMRTVAAYFLMSERTDYPLHLGVTEAGTEYMGVIKSSAAMGTMLMSGIGDTLRVSLTADPVSEVKAGISILQSVGLRNDRARLVSCPTCGRCGIDLISLANSVEKRLERVAEPVTVAVMGCEVNGPGEARQADFGIAGARDGTGIVFKKGEVIGRVPQEELVETLFDLIERQKSE